MPFLRRGPGDGAARRRSRWRWAVDGGRWTVGGGRGGGRWTVQWAVGGERQRWAVGSGRCSGRRATDGGRQRWAVGAGRRAVDGGRCSGRWAVVECRPNLPIIQASECRCNRPPPGLHAAAPNSNRVTCCIVKALQTCRPCCCCYRCYFRHPARGIIKFML